jgi:surfactin synthase thioesterase subunit
MYLRWRRSLPAWIVLHPVELPGRGHRIAEPAAEHFERLVERLCEEHSASMSGRYALFGHSMGALLAYGMAVRSSTLSRALPLALFLSATAAPSRRNFACFADGQDDASLIAILRKQGGTPAEVFANPELLRMVLDVLGSDYRLCSSFQDMSSPPLPAPIYVFAGAEDDIEADRLEAWRLRTSGDFSLQWFDGGHFFIQRQEAQVLSRIPQLLLEASRASPSLT